MASEYTVRVKVEPIVKRFLYAQFGGDVSLPFIFPKRHKFNRLIETLLIKPPDDYRGDFFDSDDCVIELAIPNMELKDVRSYNYMSEKMQRAFNRKMVVYMTDIFEAKFRDLRRNLGLTKEEAIDNLSEDFGFLPEDYDRLVKHYYRWENNERNRKYRKKKKLEKQKKQQKISAV